MTEASGPSAENLPNVYPLAGDHVDEAAVTMARAFFDDPMEQWGPIVEMFRRAGFAGVRAAARNPASESPWYVTVATRA